MTRQEADALMAAIVTMRESATDEQALSAPAVYPVWRTDTTYTETKNVVMHNGILYRCRQSHTSQANWEPGATPALWAAISLEAGTKQNPITAVRGMEYESGKYYKDPEDGNTYLCTRSGILYYMPHELIGQYFEL